MSSRTDQGSLFAGEPVVETGTVWISDRSRLQTEGDYRVVSVSGLVLAHYAVGDQMSEALAMVSLVDQGWALQTEVARAFGCSERTVRRHQRRFESGGLSALGRSSGYPKGRPRLPPARSDLVSLWKAQGLSNREIARRSGVTEKAVRKLLRRLGWKRQEPEQLLLLSDIATSDRLGNEEPEVSPPSCPPSAAPRLSGVGERPTERPTSGADISGPDPVVTEEDTATDGSQSADPNLSGVGERPAEQPASGADISGADPVVTEENTATAGSQGADPNLSGAGERSTERSASGADISGADPVVTEENTATAGSQGADPNLSGASAEDPWIPLSFDKGPGDRSADRLLACFGLLDDAAPRFGPGTDVAGAGALLALPALLNSGVLAIARQVYGSLGPAFYGLRTTLVTLLLMALLRIQRPEGLKERSPQEFGRILGLDRAPEVKTLRRKLARLAAYGRAAEFGRALAARRVANYGPAMGFLYVDGHVRAYHGKRKIPKTHVTRMRISMPATTDYWVNDTEGEPLFVVTTEANRGLVEMLPKILSEIRPLVGDRRITVVFDRGGWSPELFKTIIDQGFDVLTYRKGRSEELDESRFSLHEATLDGRLVRYLLADEEVFFLKSTLQLRQVTRLCSGGHQTRIITSRKDLKALEVAYRMFERWRQENFFKYLRQEYALDALVDYGIEPADPERSVPNPKRKELDAQLKQARTQLSQLEAEYGLEAIDNPESRRRTMRGFKIANAQLGGRIRDAMKRVADILKQRAGVPLRVPVEEVVEGEIVKLATERKHLTDLLKMVAYQAEGDLFRLLGPHYKRSEDEGRTLIQNILANPGDIAVSDEELRISLQPLSSPHRTQALAALCEKINATKTLFPGSKLRLLFAVQNEPKQSLAFPGPRVDKTVPNHTQPDI